MKHTPMYTGLSIGAMFTLLSLLLTATFLVPIFSVLPGVFFEIIAQQLTSSEPYSRIGKMTVLLMALSLLVLLTLLLLIAKHMGFRNIPISRLRVASWMVLLYFIVHPLGFYLYWGLKLNFRSDGQLLFGAVNSFPFSSFSFLVFGCALDYVWNMNIKKAAAIQMSQE